MHPFVKSSLQRILCLAGACALLLVGIARAATTPSPYDRGPGDAGISTMHLSNGLRVVVAVDRAAPVVQTSVWYDFGSLYETPGKTGLAHALEHMMFRGSEHISAAGIDDISARLGAQMNAQTSYDYTEFYFVVPADKVAVPLALEADRMAHLNLKPAQWAIERRAVINEIRGDLSSPFYSLLSRVRAAAFPGSPMGRTALGSLADVEAANVGDLRTYYHEWYAPNNATLVIAGDISAKRGFALAEKYFGAIPRRTLPPHPKTTGIPATGKRIRASFPFPFQVLDFAYVVPGDRDPGEPEISTLATLIGDARSPFYRSLVQSNVALQVQAQADTQLHQGLLDVLVVLNPGHSPEEATAIYNATMGTMLSNGFPPSLVRTAKRITIAQRVEAGDSIVGIGDLAGYTYGVVGEKIGAEDARLAAITPASLLSVARRYLHAPNVVGRLSPSDKPGGSGTATSTTASDNFSTRAPQGTIREPAWIARAIRKPSTARSVLKPVQFRLANGIRIVVQYKPDRPTFVLRGSIASVPSLEPDALVGIASLASDLANFGSVTRPFARRTETIEDMGASVNFGSAFGARGRIEDFARLVAILADGERHPSFVQPWLDQERGQLANSVGTRSHIASVLADEAYDKMLLPPGDPALRIPTRGSISSIHQADLLAYVRTAWRPDLTSIAVVGDLAPSVVERTLQAAFGSWKNHGPRPKTTLAPLPLAHEASAGVITDANQVFVKLGQPAVGLDNRSFLAFRLLNQLLGAQGAFESRLWQALRQRSGLVYSVASELQADPSRGALQIEFAASPNNVEAAVRIVRAQLDAMRKAPPSATSLEEAKTRLLADALIGEESSGGQAAQALSIADGSVPADYYATLQQRLAKITPRTIQRVAIRYLRPHHLIAVYTGPHGPWDTGEFSL